MFKVDADAPAASGRRAVLPFATQEAVQLPAGRWYAHGAKLTAQSSRARSATLTSGSGWAACSVVSSITLESHPVSKHAGMRIYATSNSSEPCPV